MPIDHVYTWVNDQDEALNDLRRHHSKEVVSDRHYKVGVARIADHGELRSSIRNAQRFLPFVRKTFIFGSGRAPDWLNEFGDSVVYVPQSDVIPASLWPSFQSDVVEAFVHRIPNLSERYIYSNDDCFFADLHSADDFFSADGKVRLGRANWPTATGPDGTFRNIEINGVRALQKRFSLPSYKGRFAPLASETGLRERLSFVRRMYRLRKAGLRMVNGITHVSQPHLRSAWVDFHEEFKTELDRLFQTRFRSEEGIGVNFVYFYYLYALGKAEFYDGVDSDRLLNRSDIKGRTRFLTDLGQPDSPIRRFCLNDSPVTVEDGWADYIGTVLARLERR